MKNIKKEELRSSNPIERIERRFINLLLEKYNIPYIKQEEIQKEVFRLMEYIRISYGTKGWEKDYFLYACIIYILRLFKEDILIKNLLDCSIIPSHFVHIYQSIIEKLGSPPSSLTIESFKKKILEIETLDDHYDERWQKRNIK